LAAFGLPADLAAQECAEDGNQHTRGADVELSYAARRDDPQPKEKRYARAIEKLEPALQSEEPLSRAYLLAGQAYLGLRDYAGADSMLTKLTSTEPGCSDLAAELRFNAWVPLYNQGINFLRAAEEDQALEAFLKANVIYFDSRSLTNAANIFQSRGEDEHAMELYRQALSAGGDADMVRAASINLAELLRAQGNDEDALAIYSDYASANPDDVLGRLNYAIALMDSGDMEGSQEMFQELMARDDLSFRQWSQVGIGLYRAQNFEQASTAFERAHELNPMNKETLENLANTYYQSERYEELLSLADTLVQRYPNESVNYNLLANAYRELDDADGALSVLQRRDGLEFEFLRSQMVPMAENVYSVEGQVMNKSAAAGSEVVVSVELLGEEGQVVSTEELTLTLPGEGEASAFQLQIQVEDPVTGFRYEQAGAASDS
jgi:tetratricopeptide (TPR) repeat protein